MSAQINSIVAGTTAESIAAINARIPSTPMEFGAKGDEVTDDTAALLLWAASGRKLKGWGGRKYGVKASITLEADTTIVSQGPHEGLTVLDGFVGNYVLLNTPGTLTEIAAPTNTTVIGSQLLQFASAPPVSANDVICIYDDRDGSYLADRTYYRAGEWLRVAKVSGTDLYTKNGICDVYTPHASVHLYKMSPDYTTFPGVFTIDGAATYGRVYLSLTRGTQITLNSTNAGNSVIATDRCVEVVVGGETRIHNAGNAGNDYGIVYGNSAWCTVQPGSNIYSRRHAITTGGSDVVCCVPCQDITTYESDLSNDPTTNLAAADFHGHTRNSRYIGCTSTGVTLGGENTEFVDGTLIATQQGWVAYVSELRGGNIGVKRNRIIGTIDPSANSRGLFDAQGTDNAIKDVYFSFVDNEIYFSASSTSTKIAQIRNVGKSIAYNVKITGNNVIAPTALGYVLDLGAISGGTVNANSRIEIDNNSGIAGTPMMNVSVAVDRYHGTAKLKLQRQSTYLDVTADGTSTNLVSALWTYPMAFPKQPICQIAYGAAGTSAIVAGIPSAHPSALVQRATNVGMWGQLHTQTAIANGTVIRLHMMAEINEF